MRLTAMMVWLSPVSATLAGLFAVIELWRTADRFWLSAGWWSWGLLTIDILMALVISYASPAFLPDRMRTDPGVILLLAVGSASIAARPMFLFPLHGGPMAARRLITLRRFVLQEIERRARPIRILYLMETVYPAGAILGDVLPGMTRLLLQDWERTRNQVLDEDAKMVLVAGKDAVWDVETLMPILIKYGGLCMCSKLVQRAAFTITLASRVGEEGKLAVAHPVQDGGGDHVGA